MATTILLLLVTLAVYCATHSAATNFSSTPSCSGTQNSYLWRVDVNPPVYLFGTIHAPYASVWNSLPENVKNAFSSSDGIYLELLLSNPDTSRSLVECQLLPNNQDINQVLPSHLVKRIENYLSRVRRLLPSWLNESPRTNFLRGGGGQTKSDKFFAEATHNWRRKRPISILALLSSLSEESVQNWDKPALDHFLDNVAKRLNKDIAPLETPNEHCQPLKKLSDSQVETALRVQLDYLDSLLTGPPPTLERDLLAYRCGDLRALIDSQPFLPLPSFSKLTTMINITDTDLATLRATETILYNKLATRRNRRMTRTIHNLLSQPQRNDSLFIGIGAAHLIGTKSIVDRLRRRGYTVHHLSTSDAVEGPRLPENIIALGDPNSVAQQGSILSLPEPEVRLVPGSVLPHPTLDEVFNLIQKYFTDRRRKRAVPRRDLRSR